MSVLLLLGWLMPIVMVYLYNEMGMPEPTYIRVLYFTGPFAVVLVFLGSHLKSRLMWYVSGIFLGVVLLGQWMPLSRRGLFFVRAEQIRPGMTLDEVRSRLFGFMEQETVPAPNPFEQEFVYGWDLDGDSSMDSLTLDLKDGRVRSVFLGSE